MTTHRTSPARRVATFVGALGLGVLCLAAPTAGAAAPHPVDPTSLQPALNPDFAPWTCFEAGRGITCQGGYEAAFDEVVGQCDGRELRVSGTIRERMTRWHTADGLATRTSVHLDAPGDVFSLEGTEEVVTLRAHWNRHYTYPVPGDRSTRIMTEVGNIYMATAPREGNVLHDAGLVRFSPGLEFEEISTSRGKHEWYADPAGVETIVCDLLA